MSLLRRPSPKVHQLALTLNWPLMTRVNSHLFLVFRGGQVCEQACGQSQQRGHAWVQQQTAPGYVHTIVPQKRPLEILLSTVADVV